MREKEEREGPTDRETDGNAGKPHTWESMMIIGWEGEIDC